MEFTQSQIKSFQQLGISLVYLFGSYAEGRSLPLSDIDIGIVFFDESSLNKGRSLIYNKLYDIFTDVFVGEEVDIVFLQKATLELRFDVIKHGRILYAASIADKLDFEEKTMLFYADFKPLLVEFNQSILNRS
jgi:predicted nucleotidyltransferase